MKEFKSDRHTVSKMKNQFYRHKSHGQTRTRWKVSSKSMFLERCFRLKALSIQLFLVISVLFCSFSNLPPLVTIRNSLDSQHVVTHSVSPRDGVRKYSYPFTFEFSMRDGARYPELFVEAVSFGFFNNRRIEGNSYYFIYHQSISYIFRLWIRNDPGRGG